MGLLISTVGSFPKPKALVKARERFAGEEIPASELRAAEDQATREILALQEQLGIDLLVDGEMDRGDMTTFFADRIEGMEVSGLVRAYGNRYYHKPVLVGEVRRTAPMTVERFRFAQGATGKPVKAVLTGPYTLMDWSFDEYYPSREEACLALAEVIREEAEDLLAAGARDIQIDEPAISARPEELPLATRALSIVTAKLRGKARTWAHICYGDFLPVLDAIVQLPVDGLLLELANSEFDVLEALACSLPSDRILGAGVLDVHSHLVETPEEVRGRIERVLEVLPADRVWLNPDCGLKTRSMEEAHGKLTSLVLAARAVREARGI